MRWGRVFSIYYFLILNVFHVIEGAMDTQLLEALFWKGVPVFDMQSHMETTDVGWGTPKFHKMGREKVILIHAFLSEGYEILMCDTDVVFLQVQTQKRKPKIKIQKKRISFNSLQLMSQVSSHAVIIMGSARVIIFVKISSSNKNVVKVLRHGRQLWEFRFRLILVLKILFLGCAWGGDWRPYIQSFFLSFFLFLFFQICRTRSPTLSDFLMPTF